jgi:hypothetical protein
MSWRKPSTCRMSLTNFITSGCTPRPDRDSNSQLIAVCDRCFSTVFVYSMYNISQIAVCDRCCSTVWLLTICFICLVQKQYMHSLSYHVDNIQKQYKYDIVCHIQKQYKYDIVCHIQTMSYLYCFCMWQTMSYLYCFCMWQTMSYIRCILLCYIVVDVLYVIEYLYLIETYTIF